MVDRSKYWVPFVLLLVCLTVPTSSVNAQDPPTYCSTHACYQWSGNGHWYSLTSSRSGWNAANSEAIAAGGYLASIHSSDEQAFVYGTFLGVVQSWAPWAWVGLTDVATEGTFVWTTGEPLSYTYWNTWEPDDSFPGQDYGYMHFQLSGYWGDDSETSASGLFYGIVEFGDLIGSVETYSCSPAGFMPPFDVAIALKKKPERAIPIKMVLRDSEGNIVSDASIVPPVVNVEYTPHTGSAEDVTSELLPLGAANTDNIFRFDPNTSSWIYNLSTEFFTAPGTYRVTAKAGESNYVIDASCSGIFTRNP